MEEIGGLVQDQECEEVAVFEDETLPFLVPQRYFYV